MAKIVLINPSYQPHWSKGEPTGLLYLSSYLESQGHNAMIIDMNVEDISLDQIIQYIIRNSVKFVGITAITRQALSAYMIGNAIKSKLNDQINIIYGGVHPTLLPEECFEKGRADFVIRGDGEVSLSMLMEEIMKNKNYFKIPGLCYLSEGKLKKNREEPIEDLDSLPYPNYSKVKLYRYNSNIHLQDPPEHAVHMITSRGCTGTCYYCSSPMLYKGRVRFRSNRNVLDEIKCIIDRYGIRNIHFHDDNFLVSPKRIEEFCKMVLIEKVRFYWICLATVDVIVKNPDILPHLKKAGCIGIEIGVESGDDSVLKTLNKNIGVANIKHAVQLLRKNGIHPMFLLMSYSLGENIETPYLTARLFYSLKKGKDIERIPVSTSHFDPDLAGHLARPSPGSVFYNIADERGVIFAKDWDDHIEEKLNFLPNEFIYDIPKKLMHFDKPEEYYSFIERYRDNILLYANQNFYISQPIIQDFFDNNIDCLIKYMYEIYIKCNGEKTVGEISGESNEALLKTAVSISFLSIFRVIKSERGQND
jgi:anaerobic magnesium-protoporphyrin IX monomethyl ester cyclase